MNDMELGNMLFGNSRGEVGIPREAAWELPLRSLLEACNLNVYGYNDFLNLYGVDNELFTIKPYYWGDCTCGGEENTTCADDCELVVPNFLFKPTGFRIEWYKYALRDSYMSPGICLEDYRRIMKCCEAYVS